MQDSKTNATAFDIINEPATCMSQTLSHLGIIIGFSSDGGLSPGWARND
jgi:hypothetical protein